MKIDTAFDPAQSAVAIKQLVVQLGEELAPRGNPDYVKIAELVNDIRLHTSDIKNWVYPRLANGDKNDGS
jgi:hypothetical protein